MINLKNNRGTCSFFCAVAVGLTAEYCDPPQPCVDLDPLPHPESCDKYLRCFQNNWGSFDCPKGKQFDKVMLTCAEEASCAEPCTLHTTTKDQTTTTDTIKTTAQASTGQSIASL